MSYEIAKILKGAAQIIHTRGWTQNQAQDKDGKCCLVHAVGIAVGYEGVFADLIKLESWSAAMAPIRTLTQRDPVGWNDAPGRTQAEVEGLLEDTAEALIDALNNETDDEGVTE